MNYYGIYPENDYRYYLQHHGILGQKWGERNGPPYPLKANQHSTAENKAGWKSSLGKSKTRDGGKDGGFVSDIVDSVTVSHNTKKADQIRAERLTTRTGPKDKVTGFNKRVDKEPADVDIKNVNPGYKRNVHALTNNCVSCSMAFELRRRGYDVMSKKSDTAVPGTYLTIKSFKNAKPTLLDRENILVKPKTLDDYKWTSFKDDKNWWSVMQKATASAKLGKDVEFSDYTKKTLSKEKNSRGSLFVRWGVGGGHAISYEVKNGKVMIYDPQSSKIYRTDEEIDKFLSHAWSGVSIRLDNLNINPKEIKKHVA